MKDVLRLRLQGWYTETRHGWAKTTGLIALTSVFYLALLGQSTANATSSSTPVTQMGYLQWMVQVCGDASQFSATVTMDQLFQQLQQWAENKGMMPAGGWSADAALTRDVLAQTLVQLLNINPKQKGGDAIKILAKEGILIPDATVISRASLVSLIDDFGFQARSMIIARNSGSPTKGNNGVGNGQDPPPPGWLNPKNPHYGQDQNDGPGTGPGNPGNQGGQHSHLP